MLFESVPNFSEGRRADVIDGVASATAPAYLLDVDADPDHNRVVVSMAGDADALTLGLMGSIGEAARRIDLDEHAGVHPRVGAADVVPVIPLGATTLDECRELAREIGRKVWSELGLPVYFYGHGEDVSSMGRIPCAAER
jgi:glutamate formiminotransferase